MGRTREAHTHDAFVPQNQNSRGIITHGRGKTCRSEHSPAGPHSRESTKRKTLAQLEQPVDVWHQAGKNNDVATSSLYEESGVKGRVEPFISDMAEAYHWADLVLCRSGALTVSELAVAGCPAILVPYPYAVDDHQTVNGRYLVDQGAALMVQQNLLNENSLADMLRTLLADPGQLTEMSRAARSVARPQATKEVADHCLEICRV